MAKEMPKISECLALDCAYNRDRQCHAFAITVGGPDPLCDTYFQRSQKGGIQESVGMVGSCKVDACRFNQALECAAQSIKVMKNNNQVDCATYSPR